MQTPFGLSGLDQSDRGFRARTPALQKSDRAVALIDADENYRRRLAMYEEGATFDSAPRVIAHATLRPPPTRASGLFAGEELPSDGPSTLRIILTLGLAGVFGWLLVQVRASR